MVSHIKVAGLKMKAPVDPGSDGFFHFKAHEATGPAFKVKNPKVAVAVEYICGLKMLGRNPETDYGATILLKWLKKKDRKMYVAMTTTPPQEAD